MSSDLNIIGSPDLPAPTLAIDGTMVTGVVALAQKIMILFFTDENLPASLGVGTSMPEFLAAVRNNPGQDEFQNIINLAVASLRDQILDNQDPDLPDDQRLADLAGVVETTGPAAIVVLTITSAAGDTYTIQYPTTGV